MNSRSFIRCLRVMSWFLFTVLLAGCLEVATMMPAAIQAAGGVIGGLEFEDVKVALGPGVTQETLKSIKKVALMFGPSGRSQDAPQMAFMAAVPGAGLTHTFSDQLAIELMGLGFEVVEREQLAKVMNEQALQMGGVTEADRIFAAGKILAVDAVVTGTVKSGHDISTGVMGFGAGINEVVKSATVKILGVEKANVLLAMAVTYKKGQNADEASKALAKLLKEKLSGVAPAE